MRQKYLIPSKIRKERKKIKFLYICSFFFSLHSEHFRTIVFFYRWNVNSMIYLMKTGEKNKNEKMLKIFWRNEQFTYSIHKMKMKTETRIMTMREAEALMYIYTYTNIRICSVFKEHVILNAFTDASF